MEKMSVVMVLERETKNKVRYETDDDTSGLDTIYIAKTVLGRPFPARIRVDVSVDDESGS